MLSDPQTPIDFELVQSSHVIRTEAGEPQPVVVGPRCVVADDGRLWCSFMRQSQLGGNDFVPVLSTSDDSGQSWTAPQRIWPQLADHWSIFVSISRAADGTLFLFGTRTPIERPGESFWREETKGLKQNELLWARSADDGRTWTLPQAFAVPIAGAAEAPGPLLVTRGGRWLAPFSPYNTFAADLRVDRDQVIAVASDDQGVSWSHTRMIGFDEPDSGGAEAWITELRDELMVGMAWHIDLSGMNRPRTNKFAVSKDDGRTWQATRSTGILGNTIALTPLPDGRLAMIHVQRREAAAIGIWGAVVEVDEDHFTVVANARLWQAEAATRSHGEATHDEWTDFSFGEPAMTLLPNGDWLLVLWSWDGRGGALPCLRFRVP